MDYRTAVLGNFDYHAIEIGKLLITLCVNNERGVEVGYSEIRRITIIIKIMSNVYSG